MRLVELEVTHHVTACPLCRQRWDIITLTEYVKAKTEVNSLQFLYVWRFQFYWSFDQLQGTFIRQSKRKETRKVKIAIASFHAEELCLVFWGVERKGLMTCEHLSVEKRQIYPNALPHCMVKKSEYFTIWRVCRFILGLWRVRKGFKGMCIYIYII